MLLGPPSLAASAADVAAHQLQLVPLLVDVLVQLVAEGGWVKEGWLGYLGHLMPIGSWPVCSDLGFDRGKPLRHLVGDALPSFVRLGLAVVGVDLGCRIGGAVGKRVPEEIADIHLSIEDCPL